ncbi:hypothetical protein [Salinarimonas rosea]|uniref:hypothetical protein n=1 Tax=Salinarimonas rosea TaxID=552063 RepID=UPI001FD90E35|nr:hypothetical protein [Salinarimonas rosea]
MAVEEPVDVNSHGDPVSHIVRLDAKVGVDVGSVQNTFYARPSEGAPVAISCKNLATKISCAVPYHPFRLLLAALVNQRIDIKGERK